MDRRKRSLGALAALAALALVAGCGLRSGAAVSESGWKAKADQTLGAAVSSLATTELVLENQRNGHLTRPYVLVAVREAQSALATEIQTFQSKQPPADRVADTRTAMEALGRAQTVLDSASNAASGGDVQARSKALREVKAASQELSTLQKKLTGSGG